MYSIAPCKISSLWRPPLSLASSSRPRFLPLSFALAIFFAPSSRRLGTVSLSVARQSLIFSLLRLSINECETFRFEAPPPFPPEDSVVDFPEDDTVEVTVA